MNYIITGIDEKFIQPLFVDFLTSLFIMGRFRGKLICYYYYKEDEEENSYFTNLASETYDVTFIKKKIKHDLNQSIYIYLYELFSSRFFNENDKIAIYDSDVWFQDEINSLFEKTPNRLLTACERNDPDSYFKKVGSNFSMYYNKPNIKQYYEIFPEEEQVDVIKHFDNLAAKVNFINSGMIFGCYKAIKDYITWIGGYYESYPVLKTKVTADQFLLNYYLDDDLDELNNYIYNYCIFYSNGWKVKDNKIFSHKDELVKAVHLQKFQGKDHSFTKYYPEINTGMEESDEQV